MLYSSEGGSGAAALLTLLLLTGCAESRYVRISDAQVEGGMLAVGGEGRVTVVTTSEQVPQVCIEHYRAAPIEGGYALTRVSTPNVEGCTFE